MTRALLAGLLACAFGAAPTPAPAQLTNVDEATDVCPATADPCIVTQPVQIANGAVIDFGLRALEVRAPGLLDSGVGTVTVRCGSFTATTGDNVAISARGPSGEQTIEGGAFTLEVVRGCSAEPARACTAQDGCQLGPCNAGTCAGDAQRSCEGDEQCDLGLCSVGEGAADVDGRMDAAGRTAGALTIHAAGDVTLRRTVAANATGAAFDGGIVDMISGHGTVTLLAPVQARGGGTAQGGFVTIEAQRSVFVQANVDVSGGDFDGGFIGIDAGEDLLVDGNLIADASNGEGSGGELSLVAGNDLTIATARSLTANGSEARQGGFSGDGGGFEITAGNDLLVSAGASLTAEGAEPDGSGDAIVLSAGHDLTLEAPISARTRGNDGDGGDVGLAAGGAVLVIGAVTIDVRGGTGGGGSVLVDAGGPLEFAGTILADAGSGTGDTVALRSAADASITGDVDMGGVTSLEGADGSIEVTACQIQVGGGAAIVNTGAKGLNTLTASAGIGVQGSAQITAQAPGGKNRFVIGPDSPQPVLQGTVSPAPEIVVAPDLAACAECGNGNVDQGETCDDANEVSGDGCSECQDERCIAQTINWPDAPLCNDDAACTTDACNTVSGECEHVIACDDSFACTTDSCGSGGECLHDADDALCDDGKFCTKDVCLGSSGCVAFEEEKPCDDGLGCTSDDACSAGRCSGVKNCAAGSFCSNVTGGCILGETTTTTTTTVSTTTSTTLPGTCGDGNLNPPEECDDGDTEWSFGEPCSATCTGLDCGDPDDDGDVRTTDSLIALRTAVGSESCAECLCDIDTSGNVTATDALALLRGAVGLPLSVDCPSCTF